MENKSTRKQKAVKNVPDKKNKEPEVIVPPSEDFMNFPIEYGWTNQDIVNEYRKVKDKKKVSKIYLIPVPEVTKILKQENAL